MNQLSKTNYALLGDIIFNNSRRNDKLFDKRDNTFLKSNRDIAKVLDTNPSKVDRLFREMKKIGIVTEVINVYGEKVRMLKPAYFYKHNKYEFQFMNAQFHLGSHEAAVEWKQACFDMGVLINPETGEIEGDYDWTEHQEYAESYDVKDRCYRSALDASFELEEYVGSISNEGVRKIIDTMDLSWCDKIFENKSK